MSVQVDFTWLVGLLLAFFGFVGTVFKLYDKRQDQRFAAQDKARDDGGKELRDMIGRLAEAQTKASETMAGQVGAVEQQLRSHGERMARIESDVAHVPTHEDLGSIHKRIDDIQKDVGRLPGIERLLHDINDFLLDKK